jgi:hypothetical protein
VDVLEEDSLVLVGVTLGLQVQLVVHMVVDLLVLSALFQESSKYPHSLDPGIFYWGSRVG